MKKERFCCISCGNLLDFEQAHSIFRTGFYRNVHPLGCCNRCLEAVAMVNAPFAAETNCIQLPTSKTGGHGLGESSTASAAPFSATIPMVVSM